MANKDIVTLDDLETALATDNKIKLAGIDVDGTRSRSFPPSFC